MENKNKIIIFGILISFLLILVIVNKVQSSPDYRLNKNLKELGFVSEKDSSIYTKIESDISEDKYLELNSDKINSEYIVWYYNISNKQLTKKHLKYEDGISTTFIPNYDNKKKNITYTYKVVYDNSSVIFEGKYDINSNDYTCVNIYTYEFDINNGEEAICNKVKYDIENVKEEIKDILKGI